MFLRDARRGFVTSSPGPLCSNQVCIFILFVVIVIIVVVVVNIREQ